MNGYILLPVFIILAALAFENYGIVPRSTGRVMATKITPAHQREPALLAVQKRYLVRVTACLLLALVLGLLLLLAPANWQIPLLLAYTFAVMLADFAVTWHYIKKTRTLATARGWRPDGAKIHAADTRVMLDKKDLCPPLALYMAPLGAAVLPLVVALALGKANMWLQCLAPLVGVGAVLLCEAFLRHGRGNIYCKDEGVNYACNRIYRRAWSWALWSFALAVAVCWGISALLPVWQAYPSMLWQMLLLLLPALVMLAAMLLAVTRTRKQQAALLQGQEPPAAPNHDDYYHFGFYFNPQDTRLCVEKLSGIGWTVNLATRGGQLLTALFMALLVAVLGFLWWLGVSTGSKPSAEVADGALRLHAAMYSDTVPLSDISHVSLKTELPQGTRTGGVDGFGQLSGNFDFQGFGAVRVYLYSEQPSYLVVQHKGGYVFVNAATAEKTQALFRRLQAAVH